MSVNFLRHIFQFLESISKGYETLCSLLCLVADSSFLVTRSRSQNSVYIIKIHFSRLLSHGYDFNDITYDYTSFPSPGDMFISTLITSFMNTFLLELTLNNKYLLTNIFITK